MPPPATFKPASDTDDSGLAIYLKEIGKSKTLKTAEECELARQIKAGDDDALQQLVKANLRFVVSVARNYQNQGLPLADLINEGNLGLIRAARRFDDKKNFKFISYAVWWIRQAILQALAEQSRIVKLPLNRVGTIHRIGKAQGALEQRFRRLPTFEEIALELEIPETEVVDTMRIGNTHMSLDAPVGGSEDGSMMDIIADEFAETPEEIVGDENICYGVSKTLAKLTERERQVVQMYFGIGCGGSHTLEEIGQVFSMTRERARQIKEKAMTRLRRMNDCRVLLTACKG